VSDGLSVFHVCSDYAKQSLYGQLLRAVAPYVARQFMYVPVRTRAELGIGRVDDPSIDFRFEHLLRPYHRLLFRSKVRRVSSDLSDNTPVAAYDLVHAHFLYSDGAVALEIRRRFGRPFLVAVRNTDVNYFMRYRPDLARIRNDVLREASRVVFLSPAYRDAFTVRLPDQLGRLVASKAMIVPNGISDDWLSDDPGQEYAPRTPLRLLYVGDFTPNKNIPGIVSALRLLQGRMPATLTVVGGGGDERNVVSSLLERSAPLGVNSLGRVTDRGRLKAIYRDHDVLVMPSFRETFGLTYVEALSQGLPIVHSSGQGVDGYFAPGTVAAGVDPRDPAAIADGVLLVASRLPRLRAECRREAQRFSWGAAARTYVDTYLAVRCQ
jgi:L-malate glycosyltransferase